MFSVPVTHPSEYLIVVTVLCDGVTRVTRYYGHQEVNGDTQVEDTFGCEKHADLDKAHPAEGSEEESW